VDDVRESPYFKIIKYLKDYGVNIFSYDPHVSRLSNVKNLEEILEKSKALIIVTGHKEFKEIDSKVFQKYGIKVIIDGANCLNKEAIKKTEVIYKGIGR
jgi:UDP-N-acetyl-D-mannosaminuronic acid dehydrogenase